MIIKVIDKRSAKQVRMVSLRLRTLVLLALLLISSTSTFFWILNKKTAPESEVVSKNISLELPQEKPLISANKKDKSGEKLTLFLSELNRVRSYEKTIKERFEAIRNVVKSVVGADFTDTINKKNYSKDKGVGGKEYNKAGFDSDLISSLDVGIVFLNSAPIGVPLEGQITSGYGNRTSPFSGNQKFHSGIDIAITKHSPVVSTADGIVTFAGYRQGYGNTVEISHKLGFKTLFAHLSAPLVQVGQKVCREQIIGLVGMTGSTTGPHLHYEIKRNGIHKNPKPYLALTKLLNVAVD